MDENGTIDAELVTYPVPSHITARDTLNKNAQQNLDSIYDHVCEGGNVVDWSTSRGLPVREVMEWINHDDYRRKFFGEALKWRDEWTKQQLLGTLRDLAFCDISQAYNDDGSVKPFSQWSQAAKRAISEIKVDELWEGRGDEKHQVGITKKLKFVDKIKAIEILMKNLGILVDVVRVDQTLAVSQKDVDAMKELPADKLTDILLGRK